MSEPSGAQLRSQEEILRENARLRQEVRRLTALDHASVAVHEERNRLRAALERIGTEYECRRWVETARGGPNCGKCESCIAREALK